MAAFEDGIGARCGRTSASEQLWMGLSGAAVKGSEISYSAGISACEKGSQGLLHRVTKWRQAWQAPKGSISKKLLPAEPQAAVDQELHDWSKVWVTGSGFPKPWRGLQQVAVTPPSPHHLRGLAQRFKAKTGIGVDGWQPKLWAYLTDGTLSVLASYDYTAAGQSSERALWKALLDDELVLGTGIRAATMLADLAKCYEKVSHERMWWLAAWWDGPLEVVALALESFAFGRVIRLGEACSAEVLSSTALPAGSRFAPTFLRFYLMLCLDDLLGVFRLTIYLYVDDIALRVMSTEARVLHILPQATRLLFWMLESFLGLEVARARDGAKGKCSFLQTATPSSGLTQAMAVLGVPPSTSERWLGIDYGPSVKAENQSAPVRHARLKVAKQRWPRYAAFLVHAGASSRWSCGRASEPRSPTVPVSVARPGGDVHLDLLQICPKSVEAAVLLAARSRALCQWAAAQPERAALLPAPWLTPARQLVKRRKQDGWLQHHADAVKKAVLGGFPSQEALFLSGQADTPYCQLCDDTTCFGTHQHYYWRCGSPTCATVREQLTAHDASPTFRDVVHLGVSASSSEASRWLWERGLRRTPCYGLAWSLPSQRTYWIVNGAAPELTGVLVSDGSVKGLDDLRHGGWAALQCTAEAEDVVQGLYGPLPFPDPSSVLAELWGLLHALRHAVFITAIIIDNAQVVRGLARGRAWCCSSARPYAHVWLEIWDRLDDMDILPGRELSVIKVTSHISQAKRLELPEEVQIHMKHNDLADEWAKQGADLSAPPEWATLQVKQELKATKRVLEYIGHFRVLLDGVKLAEPRPKRQQGQEVHTPQAARPHAGPRHPHVLEVCRGYSKCTSCGKIARTRLAAFQLQECRGRLQGLQGKLVKSAVKRGRVAVPLLVAAGAAARPVRQRADHGDQDEPRVEPDPAPASQLGPDPLWAHVAAAREALGRMERIPDGPACMGTPSSQPHITLEQQQVRSIIDDAIIWASFWIDRFDVAGFTNEWDYRTWCSEYLERFLSLATWTPVRERLLRSNPGRTLGQVVDDLCATSWTRAEPARQAQFARVRPDSGLTAKQRRRLLRHHFDVLNQVRERFKELLGDRAPPETASWHQWVFEPLSPEDDQGGDAAGRAAEGTMGYDDADEFAALSVHSDLEVVEAGGTAAFGTQASERLSSPNPDLAPRALQPQEEGAPAGGVRREGVLRIRSAAASSSQEVVGGAVAGAGAAVPTVSTAGQPDGEPGADQGDLASALAVDGKDATQAKAAACSAPLEAHQARAGQGSLKHGGKAPRTGSSASSAAAAGLGQGALAPLAGPPPPSAAAAAASEPEQAARGRAASAQPARSGQALPGTARAASAEPRPHTVEIIGHFVVCVVRGSYYSSVARNLGGPCRRLDPRDPGDRERLRRIRRIQRGQDPKTVSYNAGVSACEKARARPVPAACRGLAVDVSRGAAPLPLSSAVALLGGMAFCSLCGGCCIGAPAARWCGRLPFTRARAERSVPLRGTVGRAARIGLLPRGSVSYNAGISAWKNGEQWQRALALLNEMWEDVFKHVVLVALLQQMAAGAEPFTFISGDQRVCNQALGSSSRDLKLYPGSPALAWQWLRPQDTAVLFEVATKPYEALRRSFSLLDRGEGRRLSLLHDDSYLRLTFGPWPWLSGRELVLLDPPYDSIQSHNTWNVFALRRLLQRSPSSCVALWYPLVDQEKVAGLHSRVQSLAAGRVLVAELWLGGAWPRGGRQTRSEVDEEHPSAGVQPQQILIDDGRVDDQARQAQVWSHACAEAAHPRRATGGMLRVSYSAGVSACEKGEQWQRALALLSEMREAKLESTVISYNAGVSVCAKGKQWQRAFTLLSEMREAKLEPNAISYTAGISACEKGEQWQRALALLSEMWEAKVERDVISYSAGISAWAKGDQWQRALVLLSEMCGVKLEPNVIYTLQRWDQRVRKRRTVAMGLGAAQRDAGGEAGAQCHQLQCWGQCVREGRSVAVGLGTAQHDVGGGARARCHQLQRWDQRVREGRAVAAGPGAPQRGAGGEAGAQRHLQLQRGDQRVRKGRSMAVGSGAAQRDAGGEAGAQCHQHYSAGISACEKSGQWQRALSLLSEMWKTKVDPNVVQLQCRDRRVREGQAVAASVSADQRDVGGEPGARRHQLRRGDQCVRTYGDKLFEPPHTYERYVHDPPPRTHC
ncbi:unnamed protein product [Prorocentrum cordatum]|uniref:RNase H type-1 domain-containing protein n=1 Tax=Prorocentrum cordatum TaxID=2364126 RepID=A0ABN9W7K7_9DINO|nr:unnamed protein product [Polarella glacialis]